MGGGTALRVAIDLVHVPSRIPHVRSAPLPDDVLILLRVAAGDEAATARAAELTSRSGDTVHRAAAFFIEQVLLSPGADSYRVLGANPNATDKELRRNMVLLLKWLHPDRHGQGERSVFAGRVALAWDDLKTSARRAAYDQAQRGSGTGDAFLRRAANAQPAKRLHTGVKLVKHPEYRRQPGLRKKPNGLLRRALLFLRGGGKS
jgi:hypothetical protein